MTTIIYRIDSLQIVGTLASNETVEQVIEKDVIPNSKGSAEDYASLDVPFDYFKLELVNGEVVAIELDPPEPDPQPPTAKDILMDYIVDVDFRVTMIELGLI